MPSHHATPSGAIRLSADLAVLVNSSHGSDVRFLVGTDAVQMYGHSIILRCRSKYFATMFKDENEWKEKAKGIVHKPNVNPIVFHTLLYYIYTGGVVVADKACLLDLIVVAEEMELDELSTKCQNKVMVLLAQAIATGYHLKDGEEEEDRDVVGGELQGNLPISFAIRRFLVPALILAYRHKLAKFFQKLLDFTLRNMAIILNSKDALEAFLDVIPSQIFSLILASNSLSLAEYDVWNLALEWACHRTNILKSAVELQLKLNASKDNNNDGDGDGDADDGDGDTKMGAAMAQIGSDREKQAERTHQTLISDRQLKMLKAQLNPLIPIIRFTLLEPEQYIRAREVLNFFLPARRLTEIQPFVHQPSQKNLADPPRIQRNDQGVLSSNIANRQSWELIKRWIVEANGIADWNSPANLQFSLLYRASIHGFASTVFHQRCDNQGPTLVLVKTSDNHLFGGVNFVSWVSLEKYSTSNANFLFALKDGRHRHDPALFKCTRDSLHAAFNKSMYGPVFGKGHDLCIVNQANVVHSGSNLGDTYTGAEASNSSLAGARLFTIADYEVFAISRK